MHELVQYRCRCNISYKPQGMHYYAKIGSPSYSAELQRAMFTESVLPVVAYLVFLFREVGWLARISAPTWQQAPSKEFVQPHYQTEGNFS